MSHEPQQGSQFGQGGAEASQGYTDAVKRNLAIASSGQQAGWWGFAMDGIRRVAPEMIPSPRNAMVFNPLTNDRQYEIRWDPHDDLRVLGYAVYRSWTEIGEYERLNDLIIQSNQWRDANRDEFVEMEQVQMTEDGAGWRMNSDGEYTICTEHRPIVAPGGFAEPTEDPRDVVVTVDGQPVQPKVLHGKSGSIILSDQVWYDPVANTYIEPIELNTTSNVRVSYWYNANFLDKDWIRHFAPFYKVTTVAFDTVKGELIETDPDLVAPVTIQMEEIDYIWQTAIERNAWIAETAGERVLAFIQKRAGVICDCVYRDMGTYYPSKDCRACFGTGFLGGYDGPIPMILTIPYGERGFRIEERGMKRVDSTEEMWSGPFPMLEQYDLILRQNGDLNMIGPVRRKNHRGFMTLQQHFAMEFIHYHHVMYGLLEELDVRLRRLDLPSGTDLTGFPPDSRVQILTEKSPEPVLHFKGRTARYPTIMY